MNENGKNNFSNGQNQQKKELNLLDFFNIIKRRKKAIYISTIITVAIATLYSFLASPVYESTVTLKKEVSSSRGTADDFKDMFSMATKDELDTEIEIIKTRTVLEKIIFELNLQVYIEKMELSNGVSKEFDIPIFIYDVQNYSTRDDKFPQFSNFEINLADPLVSKTFYIQVSQSNFFTLCDEQTDEVIQTTKHTSMANFNLQGYGVKFDLSWPYGKKGDKVYINIVDLESVYKSLQKNITITKVGKTNLFEVSFKSKSPLAARIIANTIVEEYRGSRLAQKRQSIHSSFEFVDNQLQEIAGKLKDTELALSQFKSENKITSMAESSNEIVTFLSNLEAEKIETDLELAEYSNKLWNMRREQEKKGYVDQTYLTPSGTSTELSPFSVLLSQLSDAEIKRLELVQRRKENHPDVITIDEQIEQIKARLAEYNQNTMTSYRIIINTLRRKQSNLADLIEKYTSKLENIPGQESALIELMRNKNAYEKMHTLLLDKREELRMAELSKLQDIIIVDPARIPFKPISPKKVLNILVSIFLGLLIGIIAIFVQEFIEEKVKDIDEIERLFAKPILAIIPQYSKELKKDISGAKTINEKLVNLREDQGEYLESYRLLRTRLFSFSKNGNKAFIFTSSEANTGKSTIVANLAVSLARTGKSVLLIDGDLKKAGLSNLFNIPKKYPNIAEYLTNNDETPILYKPFKRDMPNLEIRILNAGYGGVENSSELLEVDKMHKLIDYAYSQYDFILIDTPPVTQIVDTLIFGQYVHDLIFLVKPDHTYKEGIKFAFEEIKQASINIYGFVVNACDIDKSSHKYKYGYGYGYGYKTIKEGQD